MKLIMLTFLGLYGFSFQLFSQEAEPNNTFGQANKRNLINLIDTLSGKISVAGDEDFFKFNIAQPCVVTLVANSPLNMMIGMRLYNPNQTEIAGIGAGSNGGQVRITHQVCQAGDYFIKVAKSGGSLSTSFSNELYRISIQLDTSDVFECNNTFDAATALKLNTFQGKIGASGDEDYFKFKVPKPCVVKLLANSPSNMQIAMNFYNSSRTLIVGVGSAGNGGQVSIVRTICQAGEYFIKMSKGGGSLSNSFSSEAYQVIINFDSSDVFECNNTFETATILSTSSFRAKIGASGDEDFFKLKITKPCVLSLLANSPVDLKIGMELFNTNRTLMTGVGAAGDGGQVEIIRQLCQPGEYFLKLHKSGGSLSNSFSDNWYNVIVSVDTSDVYECNNDFQTATPIACNTSVLGAIFPANDQDNYKLTLPKAEKITIIVSEVPINLDLSLGIYGPNPITNLITQTSGSPGATLSLTPAQTLQTGEYFIRITDNKGNPIRYKLAVSCPTLVGTRDILLSSLIKVYPNPLSDKMFIEIEGIAPQRFSGDVINVFGQKVKSFLFESSQKQEIDLQDLGSGSYWIMLRTDQGVVAKKITKL